MTMDKMKNLRQDNKFVNQIKQLNSIDDVQRLFAEQGANLPNDQMRTVFLSL